MPHVEAAINRVPAFGEVGVKEIYNGAIPYTPDGSARSWDRHWGFAEFLAERRSLASVSPRPAGPAGSWPSGSSEGEPTIDMLGVDPRRFGDYASQAYLKRQERGSLRQRLHHPLPGRGAARRTRPLRTAHPATSAWQALGAVFGSKVYGWERPNWFAPQGYGIDVNRIDELVVLTNRNHPTPDGSTTGSRKSGRFAVPTMPNMSATRSGTCTRMSAYWT